MNILSSFTHPQVVPNLYECLCSAEHKGRYSEECGKQSSSGYFFPTMEVNGASKQPGYKLSSKYFHFCSAEQRNSYRFGTTWGWVNDDRIFIFGWTITLNSSMNLCLWILNCKNTFKCEAFLSLCEWAVQIHLLCIFKHFQHILSHYMRTCKREFHLQSCSESHFTSISPFHLKLLSDKHRNSKIFTTIPQYKTLV